MTESITAIPTNYAREANADLHLYLLASGEAAVLIDSGIATTPAGGATEAIRMALDGRRLEAVLITHAHVDHVGGATALRDEFGARILVPRDDVGWVEDPEHQWDAFWARAGDLFDIEASRDQILTWSGPAFTVDGMVRPGDVIHIGDERIHAHLTRAHTPGHTCYLAAESGYLFTGDYVQLWGNPSHDGKTAFPPLYDSVESYRRGLRSLRELPFRCLATAHRGVLDRAAALAAIDASLDFTAEISRLTLELAAMPEGLTERSLAAVVAEVCHAAEPLSVQSVTTARAHIRHAERSQSITQVEQARWRG